MFNRMFSFFGCRSDHAVPDYEQPRYLSMNNVEKQDNIPLQSFPTPPAGSILRFMTEGNSLPDSPVANNACSLVVAAYQTTRFFMTEEYGNYFEESDEEDGFAPIGDLMRTESEEEEEQAELSLKRTQPVTTHRVICNGQRSKPIAIPTVNNRLPYQRNSI